MKIFLKKYAKDMQFLSFSFIELKINQKLVVIQFF